MAKETQLRGANVGLNKTLNDLLALQSLGANCIRWQLVAVTDDWTWPSYQAWLAKELLQLRETIATGLFSNMNFIICLVTPPAGNAFYAKGQRKSEHLKKMEKWFAETWETIAYATKDLPQVWGYDLINEPSLEERQLGILQRTAARAIRKITRKKKVIATCKVGSPANFAKMEPIDGVDYYTFHMYSPPSYTHQGVGGRPFNVQFRKSSTKRTLDNIYAWQRKHKKEVYVGEFSTARWAPGREKWFEEVIKYLNKRKWHWTYHAWREGHVWDQELPAKPTSPLWAADRGNTAALEIIIRGLQGAI